MTERIPKGVLVGGAILALPLLALLAYSHPEYFTSEIYLGGLLLLEFLIAATWMYRQVFFPLILVAFLLAGTGLGVIGAWTMMRWPVLGAGAAVGCVIMFKDRGYHFGLFHAIALVAVLTGLLSASFSHYASFAELKALSLLLLFVYAGTGARLAVGGREGRFFAGLLTGCEVFVAAITVCYLLGREVMGNPNSLGAVMGVAGAPILLWGTLLNEKPFVHNRRLVLYAICMYLVFHSHARAGIAAAVLSCGLMCLALRKYKLFAQGLGIIVILVSATAIAQPEAFSNMISASTSVLYKSQDPTRGLLASRESPWQDAVKNIRANFWFGTGFGTTDNGQDASKHLDQYSTAQGVTAENGSSYLAIVTWVGMLGVLPFFFLLLAIMGKVLRTVLWMLNTGSPSHPAIPLAMVVVASLLHAGFEDWLFAPGYYLCVFFWSVAFVLVDLAPQSPLPGFSTSMARPWLIRPAAGGVASSR